MNTTRNGKLPEPNPADFVLVYHPPRGACSVCPVCFGEHIRDIERQYMIMAVASLKHRPDPDETFGRVCDGCASDHLPALYVAACAANAADDAYVPWT
jgi:hypothetical protein